MTDSTLNAVVNFMPVARSVNRRQMVQDIAKWFFDLSFEETMYILNSSRNDDIIGTARFRKRMHDKLEFKLSTNEVSARARLIKSNMAESMSLLRLWINNMFNDTDIVTLWSLIIREQI